MFECLVGWPPFCAEDAHETYRKIVNWQTQLYFPEEIQLSPEAEDLIRCLITSADKRLGRHGADEIKAHPFFDGVDWDSLRKIEAPFKPNLSSITDTSYVPNLSVYVSLRLTGIIVISRQRNLKVFQLHPLLRLLWPNNKLEASRWQSGRRLVCHSLDIPTKDCMKIPLYFMAYLILLTICVHSEHLTKHGGL